MMSMGKCPEKLINFNAPLLSTRRPNNSNSNGVDEVEKPHHASICERIPFSWEQAPGKPKQARTRSDDELLPPKPPPGRCRLLWEQEEAVWESVGNFDDDDDDDDDKDLRSDSDGGRAGDVDDERISSNDDLDIFSLAQSVDTTGTQEDAPRPRRRFEDYLAFEGDGGLMVNPVGSHSPNFMIERFLPDAKALAAASSSALLNTKSLPFHDPPACLPTACHDTSRAISCLLRKSSSFSSPKGCGLHRFFPWRFKPKSTAVKSPAMLLRTSKDKLQWARARSRSRSSLKM